ncbi:TPA: serine/threonine-protein kinase [Streptococcus agalactiae]|nr:serine/threonine protein kinase [Streptococcus suis]
MSEVIGFGGFARISKTEENPEIVKKELLLDYIDNNQARARLKREIESLLLFESNRIVKILDFDNEYFSWYTMPYYKSNLEVFYNKVDVNEKTIIKIAINILEAMLIIESKNMVHRDLKPNNILLNSVDDLVVCDFGLTKMKRDTVLTRTLQGMGTDYFSAPEQFENAKTVDIRADIYSFGRILIWLFTKETTYNINHELIPLKYRSLITKCVEQFPDNRYNSVNDVYDAFIQRISIGKKLTRKQILEEIMMDSSSYKNFLSISESEIDKFSEDELFELIANGKLDKWLMEDFDSFERIYALWEIKRDEYYRIRNFYPASRADSLAINFKKYILDGDIPLKVRISLFKKLVNHWGNRYYVMDIIFDIISLKNNDEELFTFILDSLSEDDVARLKDFYSQVGKSHDNISPYFLHILE